MNPTHQPRLRILAWPFETAPAVDALGPYCETYWLPILRSNPYLLGRRLVTLMHRSEVLTGGELYVEDQVLAAALGILHPHGTEEVPGLALYRRSLGRLCRFRIARFRGANLEVRPLWPRLSSTALSHLPLAMQHAEPEWWTLAGGEAVPEFVER